MWPFNRRKPDLEELLREGLEKVAEEVAEAVSTSSHTDAEAPAPGGALADLRGRVESLERRYEELHQECIRLLRRASQRMKRAEELSLDLGEDEEQEPQPQQLPLLETDGKNEPHSRLDEIREMIRSRGESPI